MDSQFLGGMLNIYQETLYNNEAALGLSNDDVARDRRLQSCGSTRDWSERLPESSATGLNPFHIAVSIHTM